MRRQRRDRRQPRAIFPQAERGQGLLLNIQMDMETLILYIFAAVLSTIALVMLYLEARKNRLPQEDAEGQGKKS